MSSRNVFMLVDTIYAKTWHVAENSGDMQLSCMPKILATPYISCKIT